MIWDTIEKNIQRLEVENARLRAVEAAAKEARYVAENGKVGDGRMQMANDLLTIAKMLGDALDAKP